MPNPERKITPEDPNRDRENKKIMEMRDLQARSYRKQTEQITQEISSSLSEIEQQTFYSDSLDFIVRDSYIPSFREPIAMDNVVRNILEGENNRNNQNSNAKKYIAAAIGVAIVGGLGYGLYELYELLCRKAKDKPNDDIPLSKEDKENVSATYDIWSQQPDEQFWPTFSKLETLNPPATIADHLYFCNYTAQVSPASGDLWIWQSEDDEIAIVQQLESLYNQSSSLSTLYENITQVTYQGQKLPRNVAAEVLTLTLGQILSRLPE